jgi:hypothetical protein
MSMPAGLTHAQMPRQQNLYDGCVTRGETIASPLPICQPAKRSGIRQMLTTDPFNDDKLREECGIFGVCDVEGAAAMVALGLHALQHRGQEAAGISSFDGKEFHTHRAMGHVRRRARRRCAMSSRFTPIWYRAALPLRTMATFRTR